MTVKEARKFLGKKSDGKTDAELQHIIETAEMFKNMFFDDLLHKDIEKPKMTS